MRLCQMTLGSFFVQSSLCDTASKRLSRFRAEYGLLTMFISSETAFLVNVG